jgi:hypothetical protein
LGLVVFSRLRKDAHLLSLPPSKRRRGQRGPLPTYGKERIDLAKRAAQKRGWQQVACYNAASGWSRPSRRHSPRGARMLLNGPCVKVEKESEGQTRRLIDSGRMPREQKKRFIADETFNR